ncbi:DNA helicase/exodeoxyribonuclease V, alpha subunit [Jatrophihabitans endophyticus]|uniref:RecBCD enzyme subunit RecD n=1 Tax=Jatrophihabitans endophyticus TaxID=1206085 RepID=A0A1M5P3S3_9ACTN|nr:exodeoxyribonuclease V subunit alpha [Jatrophihabitans endophyticus]SHG95833.1 DNA helicase/exodeoxyribonuclease V, alpha subunit [Jatrophihabitans endophyticus]
MTALIPVRADGLLASFAEAGVLAPADVHVAQRLGALVGETDERVLLATALTVRGTRQGSVVLDLADAAEAVAPDSDDAADLDVELPWPAAADWPAACAASPLVTGSAGGPPLHLVGSRLWLDRYWQQEVQVAEDLLRRSADRPHDIDPSALRGDLDALFPASGTGDDQRLAVAVAALSRVAVIAGGPGTGKTTTVAQLIAVLRRRLGPSLRIALAAPTGKAAARLEEAVHAAAARLPADADTLRALSASTVHRLLGWRPGAASRFRHDRDNHLPYDVVIVDESSMVSLTLMARLLEALGPATRLVLVGDPDQLASVEAGAVLGDLVDPYDEAALTAGFRAALAAATDGLPDDTRPDAPAAPLRESVVRLRTVHRFDAGGPIAQLAALVRAGAADDALALLRSGPPGVVFHEVADDEPVTGPALAAVQVAVTGHERAAIAAARAGDAERALDALERHRVLCAHRAGPRGVRHWSELADRWLAPDLDAAARGDGHYAGQPLLVTENDYETGLYNGDTGIVIARGGAGDDLAAAFRRGGAPVVLPLVRLGEVRPLHVMTVHRAQGSQFDDVTVLLPFAASPLATRQTFYTAVTRAARGVLLVGSAESVLTCVRRPIARATGLRERLGTPPAPTTTGRATLDG